MRKRPSVLQGVSRWHEKRNDRRRAWVARKSGRGQGAVEMRWDKTMYLVKRGYEYVYSLDNQFGLFSPKWTISEQEALAFEDKSFAEKIAKNIIRAKVVSSGF